MEVSYDGGSPSSLLGLFHGKAICKWMMVSRGITVCITINMETSILTEIYGNHWKPTLINGWFISWKAT
jgi:hypothetical protein